MPKSLTRCGLSLALLLVIFLASRAAQAQVCANPGKDGPGATLSGVINTYYPGTASVSAGNTSISIGTSTGAVTPIASGDLLLVIQMQDAAIDSTNTDSYGDGFGGAPASGSTSLNNSGRYEYVVATSAAGATVSIRGAGTGNGLVYSYTNAAASGTQGQRRFQVVRVPQYSTATLGSGLTASPWNGSTGGILVFDVAGNLSLGSASVSVNGMGFRGGGTRQLTGGSGGSNTDYRNVTTLSAHGGKGEGIAGTPRYIFDATLGAITDNLIEGYPNGSTARGAPGNAGGGGTDGNPAANDQNSGGGGGGNGGAGGQGGNSSVGGYGGAAFPGAANFAVLGGGGAGGSRNNSLGTDSSGGAGGGIVMIRAGTISGSGTISANGSNGSSAENDGGGGGGAGGSVLVVANSGGLGSLTINARGGQGGDAWPTQAPNGTPGDRHGPGGGGGGGFIAINGSASTNVTGGANGITTTANDSYGSTPGSTGSVLSIFSSDVPGASSGAQCVPVLTTTKSTSTPTVTNTPTGTTATYAIVVSNAANRSAANNLNISDTLPAGFTFNSTVSVTLGGATRPSTTNPTVGDAIPNWGVFTIPGAGSVTLTFTAKIASSVANGTYQNPATATYQDPARTTSGGTTTSNYNSGSSTAEDVTVNSIDLTIAKSHTGNFTQGQTGANYSITVTNSGNISTSGTVTVTDTLPASLTATAISGTGWTCVLGTLTCTRSDALAASASYPAITLTVNVANNAPASVTNTATVSGGSEANTTNDTANDPTTITQLADLTIAKSHTGSFTQGQTGATYSITVTNSGSTATSGAVTVTDTLPASLTATAISGTGWSCVLGTLTCTRSDALAGGASYPVITLTVNVDSSAPASVTNSVSVSGGGEINTSNDTANDATTITQVPDLTIAKSHSGNFTQGQVGATYSITVTNSGGVATNGGLVTVTDTLPAGLTATAMSGTGWFCALGSLQCFRVSVLAAGASYPAITLTVTVAANAPASVTNSVSVSGGGETNTSNDTATDVTTINQLRDMTITKSHTGNFTQGQVGATYAITATNSGTSATNAAVSVTDTLPAGLTATAISGTGWTCVLGTLTCTRSDALAGGASYPAITLTVNVAGNAPASVTNTANVAGGGETNTANNTANDPTTINTPPDLTIAKSHTGNFTQGQVGATYTITVTNSGGIATSGTVTVTDTLPTGLSATGIAGPGWTCVLGTITCTRGDTLAAGSSYPIITLTVNVASNAAASVTNTVAVSGGGETNTGNDTANDVTAIDAGPPNIGLVKSVSPSGPQIPGTDLGYTITYTNTGGKPASSFIIIDPNPANVDPLERVFHNMDFKVGSMTSSPGTSGLVAAFSYSNDSGTTWTYTPVSGGGGAAAGYDRSVTNIRWTFTGNLSQISPNNTGSVSFIARIR